MLDKTTKILMAITFILAAAFFIFMTIAFVGMMIDHQCYQLEPNEHYVSTICEHYWK